MENNKPKREMLNYINVFRGLAILLIVAGHTMQFGNSGTILNNVAFETFAGGTALFVFISGFLFQYLSDKFEYKSYLKKKWTNVVLPYIITAIPGIILCLTLPNAYGNPFDGMNIFSQIGVFLTTGRVHNIPTWYIPMIVIFFLLADIFILLERKGILYKFLPILLLITIFCPRMVIEPEYLVGMGYLDKYLEYIKYILNGFVHFASIYILGMYFAVHKEKIESCYKYRWWLILFMILTSVADIFVNYKYGIGNGTISKIFLTLIVLGYLKHYDEWIKSHAKLNKSLDFIAKYSFSLFFVHWYFFFWFNQIFKTAKVLPVNSIEELIISIVIIALRFTAVTVVSLLVLYLFKKILTIFNVKNTRAIIGV